MNAEMAASTNLLQFLLMLAAGCRLQRQQAATIEYLKAENRLLRERLGGRRIVFTDAELERLRGARVGSVRDECLSKLIPMGEGCFALRFGSSVPTFITSNHQGLGNALIMRGASFARRDGPVIRRSRVGGLLNYYERVPA
jgi:hypothetical protein